jgi:serine/threonine protein kinase
MTARVFGPYRLLSRLGAGPMSEVWCALDVRQDREVVVKVLPAWLTATEGGMPWFHLQVMRAAGLNARNIIPIDDYGIIGRRLFIEMPLIAGMGLDALLNEQGPLDASEAVGVIEQIAVALDAAHDAGLVHRELTPSSALIVDGRLGVDRVYLLGLWDLPPRGTVEIATESALSTLAYLAPERIDGVFFPAGDVYALACVLFQALTGWAPFVPPPQASARDFYLDAHRHRPPPAPSAHEAAIPDALDDVVARGMAKDPRSRFPSAGALAVAARAALADPTIEKRS